MALPAKLGKFKKVGKFYVTSKPVTKDAVAEAVRGLQDAFKGGAKKRPVWILSGTDGNSQGTFETSKSFVYADDLGDKLFKSVNVDKYKREGGPHLKKWQKRLEHNGIIVLGWSYSRQSLEGWIREAGLV